MSKKVQLGNHMVPEILAHLGKMTELPKEGILAGQALSSAIMDLYAGGGGVYNDIDIFMPAPPAKLTYLASDEHMKEESLRLGIPLAQLDDYKALALSDSHGLDIAGCEQDGLINIVWCDTSERELLPGTLVYSFDINAVEVALDLEFNELTWSPGFEQFLQHRELEVTSLATPERTLLRYLKKRQEMPTVYGQDSLVKDMVAVWTIEDFTNYDPPLLSAKSLGLYDRFKEQLSAMFGLTTEGRMFVLEDWTVNTALSKCLDEALGDNVEPSGLTRLMPQCWYALKRETNADSKAFAEELVEFFEDRGNAGSGMWENVMHSNAVISGGAYVQGLRSITHRDTILRNLENHENLNGALQGLTLDEQYRCVLDLAKRAKAGSGPLVYGYVESMATPVDMWNQHNRDQFFRQMARERKGGELCEPVFTTYEQDGWSIRELTRTSQLRAEGSEMYHCVGGYSGTVKAGRCRILSIRHASNPKLASTVQLSGKVEAGVEVSVAQHYSYRNSTPAKDTKDILQEYLKSQSESLGFTLAKKKSPLDWVLPFA